MSMNRGREDPLRPVFTHLGPGPGQKEGWRRVGGETYVGAGGPEPAASWREGSGGSCVQSEGVARRAPAGWRAETQTGSVISS